MITIVNARHSFVRFGDTAAAIMPVVLPGDYKFQVLLRCTTTGEANSLMLSSVFVYLVRNAAVISDPASLAAYMQLDYSTDPPYGFEAVLYRVSLTDVLVYWPHGMPDIDTLQIDTCYKLCLQAGPDETQYFLSNSFKLCPEIYTSVLEYYCDENSYGFIYCPGGIINRARLPLYMLKPQFTDQENVYFDSDGKAQVTSSTTRRVYEILVNYMLADLHEKIKMSLSHDSVQIESDVYTGGIAKNGAYDIKWPDGIPGYSGEATAEAKVFTSPYNERNDNCATCTEFACSIFLLLLYTVATDPQPGGDWNYTATWINSGGVPPELVVEYSTDEGATWLPVANLVRVDDSTITYDITYEGPTVHLLRITPVCDTLLQGDPATFYLSADYAVSFTTGTITSNSFEINTGFSIGVTWDLSLDGGLTYIALGLTSDAYTVTGLASATAYQVVRRMHSINGMVQALPAVTVTTI